MVVQGTLKTKSYTYSLSIPLKHMKFSKTQHPSLYRLTTVATLFLPLVWPFISDPHDQLHFISTHLTTHSMTCSATPHHQWDVQQNRDANSSHQLHFIVSYPPTPQQPTSWLPVVKNVSNTYDSLDYTLPCLSPKRLKWGFPLTHNSKFVQAALFTQTSSQHSPPKQTLTLIFGSILQTYSLLDLLIKTNCLYNQYV